jgi:hypothetical protein
MCQRHHSDKIAGRHDIQDFEADKQLMDVSVLFLWLRSTCQKLQFREYGSVLVWKQNMVSQAENEERRLSLSCAQSLWTQKSTCSHDFQPTELVEKVEFRGKPNTKCRVHVNPKTEAACHVAAYSHLESAF